MIAWIFFGLTFLFAFLALDAWRLAVPWRDIPYALVAKGIGQDVSHIPLSEQIKLKQRNIDYGLGDLSGAVGFWIILALGSAGFSIVEFLK